jgi:hypothetical protein
MLPMSMSVPSGRTRNPTKSADLRTIGGGSVTVGREMARLAAGLLKRVHVELGGNAGLVVLEDADVE